VLILSASIGGGHVAAARALEAAFGAAGDPCQVVDLLDYTSAPFRRLYRRSYFELVRAAPDLVDWLGKRLDRRPSEARSRAGRVRARLTRLLSYQLPRVLDAYRPELVVHTHFLPPEILSTLRRPLLPRQAVVVTDFGAHALWMQPRVERYFVAAEEVRVHLLASGVDPERVEVTGIPVDPRFAAPPPRQEARTRLGLAPDRDVLLLMGGGMERRTLKALLSGLDRLRWPLELIVVCGRSPELLDVATEAAAGDTGLVRVRPLGFSADVPTLMAAADLVAGKPGGLTVSEALAAGRPFAVVQPYPLQEEANATYVLEHGAGVRIEPLTTFAHKVASVLRDPRRRAAMHAAAGRLGRPHAAATVARGCRDLLGRGVGRS
jgi:processive 1,2-diacylglycerol beta-glucosyltransferase